MKIGIVGGESTGKSTLAKGLSDQLHIPLLPALKPELLKESGYHTLFEWAAATHGWSTLLHRQLEREPAGQDLVVDDGVVQLYCFLQRWGWNGISPDRLEELRDRVMAAGGSYDALVVTAPVLVGGSAPGRFRSASHNLQLTRLLKAFVAEAGLGDRVLVAAAKDEKATLEEAMTFLKGRRRR